MELGRVPEAPGVYVFRGESGEYLYIGKARNLRKRLAQYLNRKALQLKMAKMLERAQRLEFMVTNTEEEAFLLENTLIKRHQPVYNVMWKDGKSYPYICIKNEPFARVFVMRNPKNDGSLYYGPYASKRRLEELLDVIRSVFPLRTCSYALTPDNIRAGKFRRCLEWHLKRCNAPCEALESQEEYARHIEQVKNILEGRFEAVEQYLLQLIDGCVARLDFEGAHLYREKLVKLRAFREHSVVVRYTDASFVVCAYASSVSWAFLHWMQVSHGCVILSHNMKVRKKLEESDEELFSLGVVHLRERFRLPGGTHVVTDVEWEVPGLVVRRPSNQEEEQLLAMAKKNLQAFIDREFPEERRDMHPGVEELARQLALPHVPVRIECVDISTLQGTETVGSVVVFINGYPARREYRHYTIRTLPPATINDYGAIAEVVERRFTRLLREGKPLPNLLLVDGGAGQVGAACEVLHRLGLNIPVFGLAKRLEVLYRPGTPFEKIFIDRRSVALHLLQHIRNEAHRFALRHLHTRHKNSSLRSLLTTIPGIGERRALALLRRFGSLEEIAGAPVAQLAKIVGVKQAHLLKSMIVRLLADVGKEGGEGVG